MTSWALSVCSPPLLLARAFVTRFSAPLSECASPPSLTDLLKLSAPLPLQSSDALRKAIRELLRHGGYKPTGRGKPASEYLLRAEAEGALSSINLAVDACNAISLHSGFPVSVVDLPLAEPPFSIRLGQPGESYVFNASGQSIDLSGLLCLCDAQGPCANAVKDSQRTKTHSATIATLSVVWGCQAFPQETAAAVAYYQQLLTKLGATVLEVQVNASG